MALTTYIQRSREFDFIVYKIGKENVNTILNIKNLIADNVHYYVYELDDDYDTSLDVCLTSGENPSATYFHESSMESSPVLNLVIKELQSSALIPSTSIEDCLIVSFHNDDMRKDVEGIGERVRVNLHNAEMYYESMCESCEIKKKDFKFEYELTPYKTNITVLYLR